ncbi:MAG: aminotransferase class I/II-fold pyridoxal phosphate-dependent enzyme [Eubacteriaceae bacterium]|nr:aminotransferase class I/II-fold pyridoxal phosphate-dependent enzyme [Eubacteriaceae bacterium]
MSSLVRKYYQGMLPPLNPLSEDAIGMVQLYANESPYDIAKEFFTGDELASLFNLGLNRYPDCEALALREAYCYYLDGIVGVGNVAAGNGSDELIRAICDVYLETGDVAMSLEPAFGSYKSGAASAKGVYIGIEPSNEWLEPDIEGLIAQANEKNAKLIFICNPFNPTGYLWRSEDIIRVIEGTGGMCVVDEAYIEFSSAKSFASYAAGNPRALVLRTISKAFGCAGLRVGFAIGAVENITAINCAIDMYSINSFSQTAAAMLLRKPGIIAPYIKQIKEERDWLALRLAEFEGMAVFPSQSNFILVRTPITKEIVEETMKSNILIRSYSSYPSNIRISVGLREENEALLEAIGKAYAKAMGEDDEKD